MISNWTKIKEQKKQYQLNVPSPLLLGVKVLTKRDAEPILYSLIEYIVMLDLVRKKRE